YGYVTVSGNTATATSHEAFYFYENYEDYTYSKPSTYSNNKAISSGTGGYASFYSYYDINSKWTGNSATGGGGYRFHVDDPLGHGMKGNSAIGNSDTGFYFEDNYAYDKFASFTGNTANTNSDYGFYGQYFAVLGAGNKAKGNTPKDCYNTTCPAGATS